MATKEEIEQYIANMDLDYGEANSPTRFKQRLTKELANMIYHDDWYGLQHGRARTNWGALDLGTLRDAIQHTLTTEGGSGNIDYLILSQVDFQHLFNAIKFMKEYKDAE